MFSRNVVVARRALRVAALCLVGGAVSSVAYATSPELSLNEAVRRAVERAPQLAARSAQVEAAREELSGAGALPDPMLMVGIDSLPVTGADAFDARAEEMTMKRIGLRQEFPARAKREAQRTVAARRADAARAEVQAARQSVEEAAANAWIGAWTAQREEASLTALRDQGVLAVRMAKARATGGTESVADALAAQASVADLDTRVEGVRARQEAARAELARWLGEDVEWVPVAAPDFMVLPKTESQLLDGVDRSIPLLPATAEVETAAAEVQAARAERRSDWNVTASYGQRAGDRSDMLMLEFGIALPLFRRNRQNRGIAAREADYQAALAMREDQRRAQAARVRANIATWQGLKRQAVLYEKSLLPLARDRSATALAAYRGGGPLRPWLDARRDELDSHLAHVALLAELGRAWVVLAYLLPTQEVQP